MMQNKTKTVAGLSLSTPSVLSHHPKPLHCHRTPSASDRLLSLLPTIALFVFTVLAMPWTSMVYAAAPAGYSEYYVPGDEDSMMYILDTIGANDQTTPNSMHAEITVTAWSDNTIVYYDHWEDGYDFDPDNPSATADETITLTNRGDSNAFQGNNIPLPRTTAATCSPPAETCYYDGRDRFYVAGGSATVSRASWTDMAGTLLSVAWEVYPVRPQLTTYILPFGEDLAAAGLQDFDRVFALVQATSNSTTVTVDFNGDGTPDLIDPTPSIPASCGDAATSVTLNQGEVYLVDDRSNCTSGPVLASLNTGTIIKGTGTLQVQYVIGDEGSNYEIRGLSAFPRGLWDDEYYAPVDGPTTATDDPVDLYLHNPHSITLNINYETVATTGSFSIPANSTVSFEAATGSYVPADSAVYLKGDDVFWGVSSIDIEASTHDWGYSLVPAFLLADEYFMGWAPGYYGTGTAANYNDSGIYITAAQENLRVFIDTDNDGTADQTYTLDRLQTQYVYDPNDGDMSDANIWATGPITIAYGQNPDTAPTASPAIDVGYTTIPGSEFIDKVLTVDKTADPVVVPTTVGSTTTFTLVVDSYGFNVDSISVSDFLPTGWAYVDDSTTITLADKSTISGNTADPATTSPLNWPSTQLGDMDPNQKIIISFEAVTTGVFVEGDITRNQVEVQGTRSVGAVTQTFVTSDFAFNTFGDLQVTKTSDAVDPLSPGDTFTYTVTIINTSSTQTLTGIAVYDPIPSGVSYVAGSTQVAPALPGPSDVADLFDVQAYNNNDGTDSWLTAWAEVNDDTNPGTGNIMISGGELTFDDNPNSGTQPSIWRSVDLSGFNTASWTFDWRTTAGVDSTDAIDIWAWSPATDWVQLAQLTGITGAVAGSSNYDLTPYISSATRVAIRVQTFYGGANEQFIVDNLSINYSNTPFHDPPNFIAKDDNYQLAPGQSMTLTFDVLVDDPLPSGLNGITNTASITSNEFLLPITAGVTNTVINPSTSSASVGDRVWLDSDGDGVLDVGETGLANVEVTLKDKFGTPIDTLYTDSNGNFLFTGVTPGNGYYVQVTDGIPTGLQQSAPTGHSDDKTDPFDLNGGDAYLVADFGYAPAPDTATFGDLVWSDADSNTMHDAGEPGISGVTVEIYLDDGDSIFEPGTDDTFVSTTVTAADGTYLFAGISASGTEDYYVYVDDTQAALTGYTNTTPLSLLRVDVDAGETFSNFDFGFNNAAATNSIRDRIWIDTNGDDEDDGESGIGGVTVALLDSSRNVIATTTTDANGYFEFNGVYDNNADYTIQITDIFGILTDYYGASAAAIAGELDIDNLSSDIDNTVEPTEPSFAYNIKSALGGAVFNDLDGNGVLDPSELSIAAIVVELYLDDGTTAGVLDGSDTLLYTDTTDANGSYIFSGLADDDYIISISPSPTGYTYTSEPPSGDDDPAAGEQQTATIAASSSNLAIDFGYQAIVSQTTSGTVWDDDNTDGVIDGGEALFENVTIDLYLDDGDSLFDSGLDTLTASISTDASGDYDFSGLLQGSYWVVITDTGSVLASDETSYEVTEGTTAPFDFMELVDLTGADAPGVNFGYYEPILTLVVISDFRALVNTDGQVIIEWVTGSELNTVGFYLLRFDPESNKYRKVKKGLLPAIMSAPQGSTYQLADREAVPGRLYMYRLIEKERDGGTHSYGPFTVLPILESVARTSSNDQENDDYGDHDNDFRRTARKAPNKKEIMVMTMGMSLSSANSMPRYAPGEALKITVTDDGIYSLPAGKIASLLGKPERQIEQLISRDLLTLKNKKQKIAWLAEDNSKGIFFYGQAIDSIYTRENVYWLSVGKGLVIEKVNSSYKADLLNNEINTFSDTLYIEEDHYPASALTSDPTSDYWHWGYVYGGTDGLDTKSFPFEVNGVADEETLATLKIVLASVTETEAENDHHISISLNGNLIGSDSWDGMTPHIVELSFSQDLLIEGLNTLEITALLGSDVPYSVIGLDSFDLSYTRQYTAAEDKILFHSENNSPLRVDGFTNQDILLFDITDPTKPVYYSKPYISRNYDSYQIDLNPAESGSSYLAVTADVVEPPDSVSPVLLSDLRDISNRADHLIITTEQLRGAAKILADYRQGQGLEAMIVDLDDIMNAFNYGIYSPLAIKDFISYASRNWITPPRFVLLAGDGTFDYKNLMGADDNIVPALMATTPNGLFPSDNSFTDLDNDGLPDIAIGRLPARNAEDLRVMIRKIMAYESDDGNWQKRMIFIADNPDKGGNFPEDSEFIATLIPQTYDVQKIYLTEQTADQARNNIINSFNQGAAFVNYFGHAATDQLAQEGILRVEDVPSLSASTGHPVVLALTCTVGQFALPGWEALSESLMRKQDGGAAAFWSPTGFSLNEEAKILDEEFYWTIFRDGERILGNAILRTLRNHRNRGDLQYLSATYTLLGDPAMRLNVNE